MYAYSQFWVSFYHERNVNVITFNYRGVSLSEGTPSMAAIKSDAVTVALFARIQVGKEAKLAAHGISLGGACASHLAK